MSKSNGARKIGLRFFLLGAAFSLIACSFFSRVLAPALGTTSEKVDLIAYTGVDGNIYTIDRQGENRSAITKDAVLRPQSGQPGRIYQQPTWSPSAGRLAFLGFSGSVETLSTSSLYTANAQGSELVEAFHSRDYFPFYLYWTPDGDFVSFLSNSLGGDSLALHLAPAGGGESQVLLTGQPFYWSWAPKAREMVIHTGGSAASNEAARLAIVHLNGEVDVEDLSLRPSTFQAPAWSPTGNFLVLAAEKEAGNQAIFLVRSSGEVERELAVVHGPVAFSWSPDGRQLAYAARPEGVLEGIFQNLNVVDVDASVETNLTQDRIVGFFWSPDNAKIAYLSLASGQTGGASLIAQRDDALRLALKIVDLSQGTNRTLANFTPTADLLGVLPFYDQYQRSGTIWSPDSRALVYTGLDESGAEGIYVAAADGSSPPVKIAEGSLAFWSWK